MSIGIGRIRLAQQPRPGRVMKQSGVEQAFTLCERDGALIRGSEASGDRMGVRLEVACPHGYRAIGVFHTHPGGVPVLSPQDIKAARLQGMPHMCVGVPDTDEIRCYKIG